MFCRHVFGNISGGFRGISRFLGISRDFAEMPEFRGSATARNIRSPAAGRKVARTSLNVHLIVSGIEKNTLTKGRNFEVY